MKKHLLIALISMVAAIGVLAGDGIPMGNAVFYPAIEAQYSHTDNLFLQDGSMPAGNVSDYYYAIRPTLGFEFPFKESYVRLDLSYQYKDYHTYTLASHDTWLADFKGRFHFTNDMKLNVDVHYIRGVQEVLEFDPGYETPYNNTKFYRLYGNVGLEIPINRQNSLTVYGLYNMVHFYNVPYTVPVGPYYDLYYYGGPGFYSYEQPGGGLTWRYHYNPESNVLFDVQYNHNSPDITQQDYLLYTNLDKKYDYWTFMPGWEGSISRRFTGYAKVGYGKMRFYQNSGADFSGLVVDAGLGFKATETVKLDLKLNRTPYQSTYNRNNYYTATGGTFQIQQQVSRYLFWSAGYLYQENSYPQSVVAVYDIYGPVFEFWMTQGQFRKDTIDRAYGEIGFHFTKQFSLRANYQHENRNSTIHYYYLGEDRKPYSYSENRFSFQAQFGW